MKVRNLLGLTAAFSTIVGAAVVYLVLTVPNDLKAASLLRDARKSLAAGKADEAQTALSRIVEQHPRTDAAAAATVALVRIADQERGKLEAEMLRIRKDNDAQTKMLNDLRRNVETIRNTPPPKPVVIIQKPAPVAKKVVPKRPVSKKRTPTRRRR